MGAKPKAKAKSMLSEIDEWKTLATKPGRGAGQVKPMTKRARMLMRRPASAGSNNRIVDESESEGGDRSDKPRDRHKSTWLRNHRSDIPDNVLQVFDGQERRAGDLIFL